MSVGTNIIKNICYQAYLIREIAERLVRQIAQLSNTISFGFPIILSVLKMIKNQLKFLLLKVIKYVLANYLIEKNYCNCYAKVGV